MQKRLSYSGFTIVELLVVIVVIGILAVLVIGGYSAMSQRAITATLQSDLSGGNKVILSYYSEKGVYPVANNCTNTLTTEICLKPSGSNTFTYASTSTTYSLHAQSGSSIMKVTDSNQALAVSTICPVGFITVPGSTTYGTSDFCVMKYEAKADDNGDGTGDTSQNTGFDTWPASSYPISTTRKIVSTPAGYPITAISQNNAVNAADSASNMVYNCPSGCHLITEAEWMTIAQNVLSNPINWSGGAVGSGYIYSGHNDNIPATALQAGGDSDGYANTGNSASSGVNQKRTLTLTNGEVIWDLAGNVSEWTAGQTTGGQPGASTNTGFQWTIWSSVNVTGSLAVNPFPTGTGIAGASAWTSAQGIGRLYSYTSDASLRIFARSGHWNGWEYGGVLSLQLSVAPSTADNRYGFRVSK